MNAKRRDNGDNPSPRESEKPKSERNEDDEDCFWLEDDAVIAKIREIEATQPSRLLVKDIIASYKSFPNHPIVLSCLAGSISKVFGGIDPEVAIGHLIDVEKGSRHQKLFLRDVVAAISDAQEAGTIGGSSEEHDFLLPVGVTGEDWADAICAILNTGGVNNSYCFKMGHGTTSCKDFVRLAQPLKKESCSTADLVPLFRHLWVNPYLGGDWDDEMAVLHDKYNNFIESRPWLYKALDPGFVIVKNPPAPATLAAWMNNVPTQACPAAPVVAGVSPAGLAAPPNPVLPNCVYRVAGLHEARQTLTSLRQSATTAGHPGMELFAVTCALGNCTRY